MKFYWVVAFALGALVAGPSNGELYRWVDESGNVHYSDKPPPPSARKSDRRKLPGNAPASQSLPYELQQATKNFPVTLFVTDCGEGCAQARELLARRGIPHTELDATDPGVQEQLKKITGGRIEVPVLRVGRQTLRGFQPDQWNSALNVAGYPKTALVKVTPTRPQTAKPEAPPTAEVEGEGESVAEPAADSAQETGEGETQ